MGILHRSSLIPRNFMDPEVKKLLVDEIDTVAGALTASTSSDQAGGVPITKDFTVFDTVGTAGDSATLPKALPGRSLVVKNNAAANSMDIFPSSGESINALSGDAAYALAVTKSVLFFCVVAGKWHTILTA